MTVCTETCTGELNKLLVMNKSIDRSGDPDPLSSSPFSLDHVNFIPYKDNLFITVYITDMRTLLYMTLTRWSFQENIQPGQTLWDISPGSRTDQSPGVSQIFTSLSTSLGCPERRMLVRWMCLTTFTWWSTYTAPLATPTQRIARLSSTRRECW